MKDKKPKHKAKLEIIGLMNDEDILFKKIPCTCSQDPKDVLNQFPFKPCIHCHGEYQEKCFFDEFKNRECFDVKDFDLDKNYNTLPTFKIRTITKVTIVRDKKTHEIRAYTF